MKKILYFLIGFSISLLIPYISYAVESCQDVQVCARSSFEAYAATTWPAYTVEFKGTAATNTLASALLTTFKTTANCSQGWGGNATRTANCPTTYIYYALSLGTVCNKVYYIVVCEGLYSDDTDGDGLSSAIDPYPDDPTPFSYTVLETIKDSFGNTVWMRIKTDRGDIFEWGTKPTDMTGYNRIANLYQNMLPSTSLATDIANLQTQDPIVAPTQIQSSDVGDEYNSWVNNTTTLPPDSGIATDMTPGVQPTGSETDSQALGQIASNTGKTADNVARLGDYMKQLNDLTAKKNAQDLLQGNVGNSNTATATANATATAGLTQAQATQAVKDGIAPNSSDTSAIGTAVTNLNTSATSSNPAQALADAQALLETETTTDDIPDHGVDSDFLGVAKEQFSLYDKLSEVISNNPISDALTGIEVNATGSCSMTWPWTDSHGSTHNVILTICDYATVLNNFGQILLMLVSFNSLLILFRR